MGSVVIAEAQMSITCLVGIEFFHCIFLCRTEVLLISKGESS